MIQNLPHMTLFNASAGTCYSISVSALFFPARANDIYQQFKNCVDILLFLFL